MRIFSILLLFGLFTACKPTRNTSIPVFEVKTLAGTTLKNTDLVGKIVVVKIWATWCGPCLAELELCNTLQAKYAADTNIVFIAISDEPETKVQNLLNKKPFNYQQVANAKELKDAFKNGLIHYIPHHIIIDQTGKKVFDKAEVPETVFAEMDKLITNLSNL